MLIFSPKAAFKFEGGRISGRGGFITVDGTDDLSVADVEFSGLIFTNPNLAPGGSPKYASLAVTHESSRPVVEINIQAESEDDLAGLLQAQGLVWNEPNGCGRVTVGGLRGAEISDEGGGVFSFSAMASTVVVKVESDQLH